MIITLTTSFQVWTKHEIVQNFTAVIDFTYVPSVCLCFGSLFLWESHFLKESNMVPAGRCRHGSRLFLYLCIFWQWFPTSFTTKIQLHKKFVKYVSPKQYHKNHCQWNWTTNYERRSSLIEFDINHKWISFQRQMPIKSIIATVKLFYIYKYCFEQLIEKALKYLP